MSHFTRFNTASTLQQYLESLDPATASLISLMDEVVGNQEAIVAGVSDLQFSAMNQYNENEINADLHARHMSSEFESLGNDIALALEEIQ